MIISIIVAISKNQVIGKNNQLIWHLPKDMKFFMDTTMDTVVIMGRKNYESIPKKYRPLNNRKNVIITRNKSYNAEGCTVVNSIDESLKVLNNIENKEVFVIGGGEIYKKFLEKGLIDRMYITHIDEYFDGDTFFPDVNYESWKSSDILYHSKD
ncbi:MAG: diacylglycerol kinase [Crocinitomicaceae bacterium]|nr:diacylglycerol kinase [Crocinitomicaceae bacterium]